MAAWALSLTLKPEEVKQLQERTLSQSLEVLRNRIDQFGVTEPVLVRQGAEKIVVQLPGIQDPQRALDLIGQTAQLEFKLVDDQAGLNLPGSHRTGPQGRQAEARLYPGAAQPGPGRQDPGR